MIGSPLGPYEPRQLGGYRLLSRLGHGGFGNVYFGVDSTGRRVAVKMIRPELVTDAMFRERFRREAESAKRVARRSTAEVLDFDDRGPLPYLVTEFIDGPTLYAWIRDNGPMRGSTAEQLAVSVASALVAIHEAGIVHRDLKPSNVLLSPAGPRVIDFGISRTTDSSDLFSRGTTRVGTLGYMAPEQFDGRAVSAKTDVFAWGALTAFAGTGTPPFGTGTDAVLLSRTLTAEPQLDGLEPSLRRLARRSLDKDPDRRPDAAELLSLMNDSHGVRRPPR
jgi:serine/threonine protein kinase